MLWEIATSHPYMQAYNAVLSTDSEACWLLIICIFFRFLFYPEDGSDIFPEQSVDSYRPTSWYNLETTYCSLSAVIDRGSYVSRSHFDINRY
jgi:hypothetical protein